MAISMQQKRIIFIAASSCIGIFAIVVFGISASQTTATVQNSWGTSGDLCLNPNYQSSSNLAAVLLRPTRFITRYDMNLGNTNNWNVCPWNSVNSGIRMATTLLVFLLSAAAVYCIWIDWSVPLFIYSFVVFATGALLTGGMVFDADNVRTSLAVCNSSSSYPGLPQNLNCDYAIFTTTILLETATFLACFVFAVFMYGYARDVRKLGGGWNRKRVKSAAAPASTTTNNAAYGQTTMAYGSSSSTSQAAAPQMSSAAASSI